MYEILNAFVLTNATPRHLTSVVTFPLLWWLAIC